MERGTVFCSVLRWPPEAQPRQLENRDVDRSNSTPKLAPVRPNESFTTHLRCVLVWAAMATGSPSIARVLVVPKPPMLSGHEAAPTMHSPCKHGRANALINHILICSRASRIESRNHFSSPPIPRRIARIDERVRYRFF